MIKEQTLPFSTSENADQTNRENYSMTNEPIKGTPFRLIGNNTQGYSLAVGKYKLTEPKETREDALRILTKVDWDIIANMIVIINKTYNEIEKDENKDNQKQ